MEGPVAEQDTVEVVMEATQEAVKVVVNINIFEAVKDLVVCSCIYEQLEVKNLA